MAGVFNPGASPLSVGPAQARNTASRIEGVKRDKVRFESFSVARRTRFFWENNDCVSSPESNANDAMAAEFKTFPVESTGSCGGLARGSTTFSSFGGDSALSNSWSSRARYSGTHNRSDNR